jgi:hypothetical protein
VTRLVHGIGRYDKGKYKGCIDYVATFEYGVWTRMLRRCSDQQFQKENPTYTGCGVSEEFLNFQDFAEWASKQKGFRSEGWQLDKDLLLKGNKVYSSATCVFLPEEINKALPNSKASRGVYPVGVEKHGPSFRAKVGGSIKQVRYGCYSTPEAAFERYRVEKKRSLCELAEKYKSQLDRRAYEALLNYDINIGD